MSKLILLMLCFYILASSIPTRIFFLIVDVIDRLKKKKQGEKPCFFNAEKENDEKTQNKC